MQQNTAAQRQQRPIQHPPATRPHQRPAPPQAMQQANGLPQGRPAVKAKKRRQRVVGILILLVSVVVLGLIAWLVIRAQGSAAPQAVSVQQAAAPSAAAAPVAETAEKAASAIPAATGPLDVAGVPPLYNRDNPITDEARAAIVLADAGGGQQMEQQAAQAFLAMQQAAAAEGVTLTPVSGFRNLERQTNNYNASIQSYMANGHSEEEATRLTQQYYAIPGTSEHEVGLAMDIGQVDDGFAQTAAYAWLQQHCTEYGFIYRYQQGYEDTTHINWEPWHYRFIGQNHAAEYTNLGMNTLEDYVAHLQQGA